MVQSDGIVNRVKDGATMDLVKRVILQLFLTVQINDVVTGELGW